MTQGEKLVRVLQNRQDKMARVLAVDLTGSAAVVFDLSASNPDLEGVDLSDMEAFNSYVFDELRIRGTPLGIGRYDEDRVVYRDKPLFYGEGEPRSVHLGIDLFVEPGAPVYAPLNAVVHSFANNDSRGSYGPTIILEHRLEGVAFFTLYGHLSLGSLTELYPGREILTGEVIGWIGGMRENGGWPPHLHFQIITDMGQWQGDFPGVCAPSQRQEYLELCPDANLILCIPGL